MGKLDGCGRCMKYSVFLANFIILLGGVVVITIGGISLYDQTVFEDLIEDGLYQSASFVLLGCGICLTLFAFLGCYGALKEIKCFLLMYVIVLLIFFVVLLIGGLLAFVFIGKGDYVEQHLKDTMDDLTKRETWDRVQSMFECCGVQNWKDWRLLLNRQLEEVPRSCCRSRDPEYSCQRKPTAINTWDIGCLTKFRDGAHIVGSVGVAVACLTVASLEQPKRLSTFLNHFLAKTTYFLNQFSTTCIKQLDKMHTQLDCVETQLQVLERKLATIPPNCLDAIS